MTTLDASTPSVHNDLFAHYGRQIIASFINDTLRASPASHIVQNAAQIAHLQSPTQCAPPRDPVGILGAGATGLYTALILIDLQIPFKVIEARDRVGGRLFTYTFKNDTGKPYNYYDVGAMRFPEHISMRRLFHLFNYPPLNKGDLQLRKKLEPYYFHDENGNDLRSYNGETLRASDVTSTAFQPRAVIRDVNPDPYIAAGTSEITEDVIKPFARRLYYDLEHNTNTGWEYLRGFDHCSTRAYMSILYRPSEELMNKFDVPDRPLTTDVVNWVETFDTSTGSYDRAFSETVLEAIAFGWKPSTDPGEVKWWCIDGGAYQIADIMHKYVQRKVPNAITFDTRVTGIKTVKDANQNVIGIDVTTDNRSIERFSYVISSIPLPVLRTIDLTGADLNPMQSNAIRQLTYGPSVKVGMQFKSAWWTTETNRAGVKLNIIGGQTYSDSPLRTVVYPSFGDVQEGKTTTLIASYSWTDDAERLGALATNEDLKSVLEELVLRELARIHNFDIQFLRGLLLEMHAWSWPHDPCTMGAFAFFGPGKFNNVYQSLTRPAGGKRLHFAGEAISTRHAWVEGALDSAWRAVHALLLTEPAWTHLLCKFYKNWGYCGEWFAATKPGDKAPPVLGDPRGGSPIFVGAPYGQWHPAVGEGKDGEPEPDVKELLNSSLLLKHIFHPAE